MGFLLNRHTPMALADWIVLALSIGFAVWIVSRLGFRRARQNGMSLAFCAIALMTLGMALGLEDGSIARWVLRVAASILLVVGYFAARNQRPSTRGAA
jgi:hypothetical protein